jgi:tocopherol O-methyltransferase
MCNAVNFLQSSGLWEKEWGEHMHHGFYDPKSSIHKSRLQAQIDMIERTITFAGISGIKSAVDVGCGIGGSSRYSTALSTLHHT